MKQLLLSNREVFEWDIDEWNQTCSNEKKEFGYLVERSFFLFSFFGFHGLSKSSFKNVKVWRETLRGEITSVLKETNRFENRKMTQKFFSDFLELPDSQLFNANGKTENSSNEWFLTIPKYPFGVWMKNIKSSYNETSVWISSWVIFVCFSGFWELQDLFSGNKNIIFFNRIHKLKNIGLQWDFDRKLRISLYGEKWVWLSTCFERIAKVFVSPIWHDFYAWIKRDAFFERMILQSFRASIRVFEGWSQSCNYSWSWLRVLTRNDRLSLEFPDY